MNSGPGASVSSPKEVAPPLSLSDNHRRTLSTTLSLLDEGLGKFLEWSAGREDCSVLYGETNDLSAGQRSELRTEALAMRELLKQLKGDLRLDSREHDAARDIAARCGLLWESLCELDAKHLRGYGMFQRHCPPIWILESRNSFDGWIELGALQVANRRNDPGVTVKKGGCMFERTMIAVDQATLGTDVLPKAGELVRRLRSQAALICVADVRGIGTTELSPPFEVSAAHLRLEAEQVLAQAAQELGLDPAPLQLVREGFRDKEIVAAAKDWHADLLVMGTHGRTGLAHAFKGSVAESVLHHAPCAVLVVRIGGEK